MDTKNERFDLGGQIKGYRAAAGKSQRKFAQELGISPMRLGHWEHNRNEPPVEFLIKICKVLDLSADDLFGLSDQGESITPKERAVVYGYRSVPEFQKTIDHIVGVS